MNRIAAAEPRSRAWGVELVAHPDRRVRLVRDTLCVEPCR